MKKFLIASNIFLFLVCLWQNWAMDQRQKITDYYYQNSEFWYDKYIRQKIHGDG